MTNQEALVILGLKDNATKDEIKAAHRRLVLKHHPDKGGVLEDFLRVQSAYETLTGKVIQRRMPEPEVQWKPVYRTVYNVYCDFGWCDSSSST